MQRFDLRRLSWAFLAVAGLGLACSDAGEEKEATAPSASQAPAQTATPASPAPPGPSATTTPPSAASEPAAPSAPAPTAAPPAAADAPVAPAFSSDDVEAIVSPVALFPDPLLAVCLQAATQPIQLVEAQRFLAQHQQNPSAAPNPAWDKSVIALLNYPDVVAMMSGSLEWTESLGSAVLTQLGDVQGEVQDLRWSSYTLGILQTNEVQDVIIRERVIAIMPKTPDKISVPQYDAAELLAAIEAGEAAGAAPIETAAATQAAGAPRAAAEAPAPAAAPAEPAPAPAAEPAPSAGYAEAPPPAAPPPAAYPPPAYPGAYPGGYAVPVSYAQPQDSFWSDAAIFAGGAALGGVIGYWIGDDDDDDWDWDEDDWDGPNGGWDRGDVNVNRNTNISRDISGNTVNVRPDRIQDQLGNRVKPGQGAVRPGTGGTARPRPALPTAGGAARPGGDRAKLPTTRPAGVAPATKLGAGGAGTHKVNLPKAPGASTLPGAAGAAAKRPTTLPTASRKAAAPGASARAAAPRPTKQAATKTGRAARPSGGALADRASPTRVAKETSRGAASRQVAAAGPGGGGAKAKRAQAPRAAQPKAQASRGSGGGGKSPAMASHKSSGKQAKAQASRGKQSRRR